jgi:hypothetical protein
MLRVAVLNPSGGNNNGESATGVGGGKRSGDEWPWM